MSACTFVSGNTPCPTCPRRITMLYMCGILQDELRQTRTAPMTDEQKVPLLPCPFCGGDDIEARPGHQNITFVGCETCHCVVSFGERERMADTRRAWNGRAVTVPAITREKLFAALPFHGTEPQARWVLDDIVAALERLGIEVGE